MIDLTQDDILSTLDADEVRELLQLVFDHHDDTMESYADDLLSRADEGKWELMRKFSEVVEHEDVINMRVAGVVTSSVSDGRLGLALAQLFAILRDGFFGSDVDWRLLAYLMTMVCGAMEGGEDLDEAAMGLALLNAHLQAKANRVLES